MLRSLDRSLCILYFSKVSTRFFSILNREFPKTVDKRDYHVDRNGEGDNTWIRDSVRNHNIPRKVS